MFCKEKNVGLLIVVSE